MSTFAFQEFYFCRVQPSQKSYNPENLSISNSFESHLSLELQNYEDDNPYEFEFDQVVESTEPTAENVYVQLKDLDNASTSQTSNVDEVAATEENQQSSTVIVHSKKRCKINREDLPKPPPVPTAAPNAVYAQLDGFTTRKTKDIKENTSHKVADVYATIDRSSKKKKREEKDLVSTKPSRVL